MTKVGEAQYSPPPIRPGFVMVLTMAGEWRELSFPTELQAERWLADLPRRAAAYEDGVVEIARARLRPALAYYQ